MTAPSISDRVSKFVNATNTTILTVDVRAIDRAAIWLQNPSTTQTLYCVLKSRLDESDAFAPSTDPSFSIIEPSSEPVLATIDVTSVNQLQLVGYYSGGGDTVQARVLAGALL